MQSCPSPRLVLGSLVLCALSCGRAPIASRPDAIVVAWTDSSRGDGGSRADGPTRPPVDAAHPADRLPVESGSLADLVVHELAAKVTGTTVAYRLTICNQGQAAASAFVVGLYYDEQTPPAPISAAESPDKSFSVAGLAKGECKPLTDERTGVAAGVAQSYALADVDGAVAESDESNNVAGPIKVEVAEGPKLPDLLVKTFAVKQSGADLIYDVQVCNEGTANVLFARADVYYNRPLPPGPLIPGDTSVAIVNLNAGSCKSFSRTYASAPVGMYSAWAQIDTLSTVQESNEKNNVAGPQVLLVSGPLSCTGLCAFAGPCGVFGLTEFELCLTWCKNMDPKVQSCAENATTKFSCSALKSCPLPPKPPSPPSPFACLDICNYLSDTCQIVSSSQKFTCIAGCTNLPDTKKQCAIAEQQKKHCLQMMVCMF